MKNDILISFILAIASAIFGAIFSFAFFENNLTINNCIDIYFYLIIIVSLLFIIIVLFNKKIIDKLKLTQSSNTMIEKKLDIVIKNVDSFKIIDKNQILNIAIAKMKESSSMRIMGTPKDTTKNNIYFKETEKLLAKNKDFKYRRISKIDDTDSYFYEHILKIITSNVRIRKLINNMPIVNYQIFDDNYILLGIRADIIPGSDDINIVFENNNKTIITDFIKHFDKSWEELGETNEIQKS